MSDETTIADRAVTSEATEQKTDAMAVDKPAADGKGHATTENDQANGDDAAALDKEANGADTEMTGTADAGEPAANDETTATPATDKKGRRKSSGVPEHKTKKTLKHKKSVKEFHTDAKPGELYLVRMKGHPSWPSIIADDDMLPEAIASRRPVTAPNPDGTWRRDEYAPGGKRHQERTFAVMFLYTNEFAWIPNSDLSPLTPEECKNVSEKSKSKALIHAYAEAGEGHNLAHYKGLLNEHADAVAEEEAAQAEREAEKARKAEKKAKRKSDAATAAADDEMDVDEDGAETKPKGKKRKKDAGEGDENEKPAKTPKTTKLKLSNPKTPATGEKSAKKKETKNTTKRKTTAKATADSDGASTPLPEKELTAEEKHAKREQEVKYCRHKLQRGLLTRDNIPSDDEVKIMSTYLKKLEDYPELEASIIRATKIHKVLKAMIKLQSIPRDAEYNFKKRSVDLLARWNQVLSDNPSADGVKDDVDDKKEPSEAAPTTNGDSKPADKSAETKAEEKDEAKEDKPVESKDEAVAEPKEDANTGAIGTAVEGDKEADAAEKTAESAPEAKTDEPDVAKAPAEEYKPPTETAEATAEPAAAS